MTSIVVFLVMFSIIVIIHELGHFYFAKRAGIVVREFAVGMGPKLWRKQGKDSVMYTLRMLPLGGYVRMAGFEEEDGTLEPGMEVGLVFNEQQEIVTINTSSNLTTEELPVRLDKIDLTKGLTLNAIPTGQQEVVTYRVSPTATIIESDETLMKVAPFEATYLGVAPWHKFLTNVAGPVNNFLLSIAIFTVLGFVQTGIPDTSSVIGSVVEQGAAAQAGLMANDRVTAVNGTTITTWQELAHLIQQSPNETLQLTIERNQVAQNITVNVTAVQDEQSKETVGQIGIMRHEKTDVWSRLTYGVTQTWEVIIGVFGAIIGMITSGFNIKAFGGPVALAQATGQVVQYGWVTTLFFMGMISANLGAFNLLPIPGLDGGKILLNAVEAVRGKPLSPDKEAIVNLIGILALIVLMIAVTWNDISRLFQ